ncbi:hypothetical protein COO60DRAFT_1568993, partial [Scenedesmus sp. NREL 46B-D3]
ADDSGCQVKVVRGREANLSELAAVLESQQEYNDRRDGRQSTLQTVGQIITGGRHEGHRKTEKFLPVGAVITVRLAWWLGGVGSLLLVRKAAKHAYVRYKEHQARERVRKALARTARGSSSNAADPATSSTAAAAAGLDAAEAARWLYVRCGHMCCCVACSQALGARRCPVCRAEGNVIKVFRT